MRRAPRMTPAPDTRPLRLLIVEHDPRDVELMIRALEKEGFQVRPDVVDTLEGFESRVRASTYDVILADYTLPGWTGMDALIRLHEHGRDIPFILVTGTVGDEAAVECIKLGVTDYVLKDRPARLPIAVTRALEEGALREERRRAEEALRESEERFRLLAENAQDVIYRYRLSPPRGFEYMSPAGTAISGYTPEEFTADPDLLFTIVHPEDRSLLEPFLQTPAALSGPLTLRWTRKDGSVIWIEQLNVLSVDEAGTPVAIEGIARDITQRKRAEETLQALYRANLHIQEPFELTKRLERLIHVAQTVLELDRVNILLADPDGKWLQAAASSGIAEPLENIRLPIGPEGGAIAKAFLTQQAVVWDGSGPVPEEMRLKPPYDRIEALRSRIFADVPLIAQGRPIGVLGVDRKYSRRPLEPATVELLQLFAGQAALAIENARLYEEQRLSAQHLESTVETRTRELQEAMRRVEQASRFKSEFLATMSHELRTPLNAIIGFSELLRDQQFGPLNDKQTRYVQNVWTSGKYLLQLINDILDLSKVEAGKLEIHPESLDLGEALHAALNQLRPLAEPKGLHMDLRMADGLALLTADPVRFNQILYNLLSNAVKFTPPGGKITLSARVQRATSNVQSSKSHDVGPWTSDEQTFVEISVEDTGIGIKAEDLPRLFQEFTQLDASLSRQHQGTGLGLALTKKLVELHGGRIWAESRGEGQGTTFTFTLPLKRPTAAPPVGKIRNTGNA